MWAFTTLNVDLNHIDLGQIFISGLLITIGTLMTVIGWLVRSDVADFRADVAEFKGALDRHKDVVHKLSNDVQKLVGLYETIKSHLGQPRQYRRPQRRKKAS
jgi:hypothetical protein